MNHRFVHDAKGHHHLTMLHPDVKLFSLVAALSSLSGLAARLRVGIAVSVSDVARAIFVSGVVGLIVSFLLYDYFVPKGSVYLWVGVSMLAGAGGHGIFDLLLNLLTRKLNKAADTAIEGKDGNN